MNFCRALIARFGLFAPKAAKISGDPFDGRLTRLGTRERRRNGGSQCQLFRNQPQPEEV